VTYGRDIAKVNTLVTLTMVTIFGVSGCSSTSRNVIVSSQLVGTWNSSDGRLTFEPDHSLVATLHLDSEARFLTACPRAWSGAGTWEFLSPQGTGGPNLAQYQSGWLVSVVLPACADSLDFLTWGTADSPKRVSLCFTGDGAYCDGPIFYQMGRGHA
jgi:hypothetical protein